MKSKGATASESSSHGAGTVDAPINGVAHGGDANAKPNPWCHTKSNQIGWWKVKLAPSNGGFHTITRVVIYNRRDCCSDVLKGATLHLLNVSEDDGIENEIEVRTLTDKLVQTYNYGDKEELSCLKLNYKQKSGSTRFRAVHIGSVGNGSYRTSRYKSVNLPSGVTSVSGRPHNSPHGDRFSARISGGKVHVKRLDRSHGWGQNLYLKGSSYTPPPPKPPPCTSKAFKPSETSAMNKFKSQCKGDQGKIVEGNCISAFFELSPYYSQKTTDGKYWRGGDLDYGFKKTSAKSAEDCAMDCAKSPKCNRFSFGANRIDGQSGGGCRISDGTYNNGKSPVSSDRYVKEREENAKWDASSKGDFKHNYWGGKVYDRKDKLIVKPKMGKPPLKRGATVYTGCGYTYSTKADRDKQCGSGGTSRWIDDSKLLNKLSRGATVYTGCGYTYSDKLNRDRQCGGGGTSKWIDDRPNINL